MWKISIKRLTVRHSGVFSRLPSPINKAFYLANAFIFAMVCNASAYAKTPFFEDFNGTAVDESKWAYPTGDASFNGRTQMRIAYPPVSNGLLHLQFDTYNPTANPVGNSFYGSEIFLRRPLKRGKGLTVEIRARMVTPAKGLVGGAFLYTYFPSTHLHSEIDFELLTNMPKQVQTNIYANEPLGIGHPELSGIPQFDMTQFNTYRIEWLPDRVRWLINDQLVRENTTLVPKEALNLHLNFYGPECNWVIACDTNLQPASSPDGNKTYFFDIDWVRINSAASGPAVGAKQQAKSPRKR
jgi:hypothetical protein